MTPGPSASTTLLLGSLWIWWLRYPSTSSTHSTSL
ncbi:hypothetical protein SRHO_G00164290, partial [Serrasalmus rhombeus]